jgi:transposase-like protein
MATRPAIFKWRQTEPVLILSAVRWYLRYSLSLRDVEELLKERGLEADHTTVWRWVQRYGPELEQRMRQHLKPDQQVLARHRPVQYLNNILEQDHRAIKRRVNAKQGFREFRAAQRTIQGYEAMNMIRKGQVRWVSGTDVRCQVQFINKLFELAA